MSTWNYTQQTEALLMKKTYGPHIDKQFNKDNVLFGRMKKRVDFEGEEKQIAVEQSIGGGRSSGDLPTPNRNKTARAVLKIKKLYAAVSIDRASMKLARSNTGSFVRFTEYPVKVAVQGFNSNVERQMICNDIAGVGVLFSKSTATPTGSGTIGSPYVVTLVANTAFMLERVEEGDLLNFNTETTELEVVAVDEVAGTISLVGTSATLGTSNTSLPFYMQKSKDKELEGLRGILMATSGTYKNIPVGRRWISTQNNGSSGSATITERLNDVIMKIKKKSGQCPNLIMASYEQYVKILNSLENQKVYNLPARDKKYKGQISFSAIEYLSPDGVLPVVLNRFIAPSEIYVLNDNHIEFHQASPMEWFDDDGTVFLRESTDSYEARYGTYADFFVNPHFQGIIHSLPL